MDRQELIDYCLTYPASVLDFPFAAEDTAVLRHAGSRKWFAFVFERGGELCINLKCDPYESQLLRDTFTAVTPGWHMNKRHWITVTLGGDLPVEQLKELIWASFELTGPNLTCFTQSTG